MTWLVVKYLLTSAVVVAVSERAKRSGPLLGQRLLECCALLLKTEGVCAQAVFGEVDAMKLRSCLTLFAMAAPQTPILQECLDRFFAGQRDPVTAQLLAS